MLDRKGKTYNKSWNNWKLGKEKDRQRDSEVAKLCLFPPFFMASQRRNTERGKRGKGFDTQAEAMTRGRGKFQSHA